VDTGSTIIEGFGKFAAALREKQAGAIQGIRRLLDSGNRQQQARFTRENRSAS
jgi:hypothetical protein